MRMLIRTSLSLILTVVAALGSAGCCNGVNCGPCPSAISLHVTDVATGSAIAGVKVTGAPGSCDDQGGCQLGSGPGSYHLHIEAPGYVPLDLAVEVPAIDEGGCCSCGFNQASPAATLTKA